MLGPISDYQKPAIMPRPTRLPGLPCAVHAAVREFADRGIAHANATLAAMAEAGRRCELYVVHGELRWSRLERELMEEGMEEGRSL